MENNHINKTFQSIFNKMINSFGYTPRWIIFCIDLAILILANLLTYAMMNALEPMFYDTLTTFQKYSLITLVNLIFFIIYRTYAGIIRHSSFIDAVKLLFSTFSSFLLLIIINYSSYFIFGKKIYLIPGLILSFVLSFTFLFLFRIVVKFLFETLINTIDSRNMIITLVYGSDANAIAVANAIKLENPARFKLVGFIDNSKSNKSKSLLGLPILYSSKKTSVIMRNYRAKALIIAEKSLSKEDKLSIIDDCLENKIKVYTIPVITNWENKKELSKQIKSFAIEDLLERKPIVLDNNLVSGQLSGKTVLISGAAGSIGSEIVMQVLDFNPKKLIIIDQSETPMHHLSLEIDKFDKKVKVIYVLSDIRNKYSLEKVFAEHNPDFVFHAAAYKHVPLMEENPYQAIHTNVLGTKNIADLAVQYKAEKFVMVSTDKAVNPSNIMGASKRIAEKYIQALHYKNVFENVHKTKFITTRFGNVLGSNGSVVPLFKKQIENGGPVTITHSEIIRYFMTIPEACQLVLEAGAMGNGGEIYIFDMGKPVKIFDLATKMIRLAGFEPDKEIGIKIIGLRPGEKLYEELLNGNSRTLSTHHDKIMIAHEEKEDFNQLIENIDTLINISLNQEEIEIVRVMKKIVPEFKSLNSRFKELD